MHREAWFRPKWKWGKIFSAIGLIGAAIAFFVPSYLPEQVRSGVEAAAIFLAIGPIIVWLCFVPILHWRERYKGTHPKLWGFFLVFEESGITRIIYWFAHVLPDWNGRGIYKQSE